MYIANAMPSDAIGVRSNMTDASDTIVKTSSSRMASTSLTVHGEPNACDVVAIDVPLSTSIDSSALTSATGSTPREADSPTPVFKTSPHTESSLLNVSGEINTGDKAAVDAFRSMLTASMSTECKSPESTLAVSSGIKDPTTMDECSAKDSTSNSKDVLTSSAAPSSSTVTRAQDKPYHSSSYERYRPPALRDQAPIRAHKESTSDVHGTSPVKMPSPSTASSSTPRHTLASTTREVRDKTAPREHDGVKEGSTPTLSDVLSSSRQSASSKTRKPGRSSDTQTSKSVSFATNEKLDKANEDEKGSTPEPGVLTSSRSTARPTSSTSQRDGRDLHGRKSNLDAPVSRPYTSDTRRTYEESTSRVRTTSTAKTAKRVVEQSTRHSTSESPDVLTSSYSMAELESKRLELIARYSSASKRASTSTAQTESPRLPDGVATSSRTRTDQVSRHKRHDTSTMDVPTSVGSTTRPTSTERSRPLTEHEQPSARPGYRRIHEDSTSRVRDKTVAFTDYRGGSVQRGEGSGTANRDRLTRTNTSTSSRDVLGSERVDETHVVWTSSARLDVQTHVPATTFSKPSMSRGIFDMIGTIPTAGARSEYIDDTRWPTAEHLRAECFSFVTDRFELKLAQAAKAEQAGDWKAWAELKVSGLDWGDVLNDMSPRPESYTRAAQRARDHFQRAVEVRPIDYELSWSEPRLLRPLREWVYAQLWDQSVPFVATYQPAVDVTAGRSVFYGMGGGFVPTSTWSQSDGDESYDSTPDIPSDHDDVESEHSQALEHDGGPGDDEVDSVVVSDDYYESDSYDHSSPMASSASGASAYSAEDYDDYDDEDGDYDDDDGGDYYSE
ncbi:uncharacterized protein B0H18DRAFT_141217 [Fomitopsis serialis]|uniref:uncharacterized protein n=1 Tax=Fomitopsis serialis TaxID=139415 RepID=UPI0020086AB0|nr:uncharacterized protein B0H18DRAFT_141217 [Neoantrodia serialis]KAH9914127.1 hypothetical protein B0H18DRAFT_141217 [Neoantrodia serialis]